MLREEPGDNSTAIDAVFTDGDGVSRAYNFGGSPTAQDTGGVVARFDATPILKPASLVLLGSGLLGLLGLRQRRS